MHTLVLSIDLKFAYFVTFCVFIADKRQSFILKIVQLLSTYVSSILICIIVLFLLCIISSFVFIVVLYIDFRLFLRFLFTLACRFSLTRLLILLLLLRVDLLLFSKISYLTSDRESAPIESTISKPLGQNRATLKRI